MRKHVCFLLAFSLIIVSCRFVTGKHVKGNGVNKSEERSISAFKDLEVDGALNVYLSQGDAKPVKIEGDENLLQYIEIDQEGDKLIVKNKQGYNLNPSDQMKVYISNPEYSSIDVGGASEVVGETKISNNSELELNTSGASGIKLEIDAPKVSAEVSGSATMNLKGQAKNMEMELSGAAHAHCYELMSETSKVGISGAGSAEVYASVKLEADVSGAGTVSYKGNATSVIQNVSGAGSVNKAE